MEGKGGTPSAFHSVASRSGPPRLYREEAFWNFLGHGLWTVVPWSVPAFLLGSARRDTSLLQPCSRNAKGLPFEERTSKLGRLLG